MLYEKKQQNYKTKKNLPYHTRENIYAHVRNLQTINWITQFPFYHIQRHTHQFRSKNDQFFVCLFYVEDNKKFIQENYYSLFSYIKMDFDSHTRTHNFAE